MTLWPLATGTGPRAVLPRCTGLTRHSGQQCQRRHGHTGPCASFDVIGFYFDHKPNTKELR